MFIISDFLDKIFINYKKLDEIEDIFSFAIVLEAKDSIIPKYLDIMNLLNTIPERDYFTFFIGVNDSEQQIISSHDDNTETCCKKIIELIQHDKEVLFEEGDIYKCKIIINKINEDNIISIYNLKLFMNYLNESTIDTINSTFLLGENGHEIINFNLINDIYNFYTNKFNFYYYDRDIKPGKFERLSVVKNYSKEITNFIGYNNLNLIPDYFYLRKRCYDNEYNYWFDKLSIIFSFCYLSNIIEYNYNNQIIIFKLSGYKTIFQSIDFKKVYEIEQYAVIQYYKIYDWVYSDVHNLHIIDKVGLARNILSMNVNNDIFHLKDDIFTSINACYDIYLKENFDKYIDVKNNVVSLLNDFSQKTADTAEIFSNKIRNNFIAYFTFFATTIIMNTISTGKIENIFTKEISTLSYVFLIISLIYYVISVIEYKKLYKRYVKNYERQKKYYSDVLSDAEINNIFNADEPYKEDLGYLRITGIMYSVLWVVSLILLSLAIYILRVKVTEGA